MSMQNDPHNTDMISQDHHHPFARRSVTTVFLVIGGVILLASSVYFLGSSDESSEQITYNDNKENTEYKAYIDLPGDKVDTAIAESVDQFFNVEPEDVIPGSDIDNVVDVTNFINAQSQIEDKNYRNSFYSFIDSSVKAASGEKVGELHDILIDKNSGEAIAIVIDDDSLFQTDLNLLSFEEVKYQEDDGDMLANITESDMLSRQEFDYSMLENSDYISLKNLESGQVFDDKGEYVGEIDALIYRDAEVNKVYFSLKQALTPGNSEVTFQYPFEQLNIVKSPDGYDIKLSSEETRKLAAALFKK